ncbi:uncharacterized protein LOC110461033 [Mizuhopecten yessoensis]|uniref:uncharacterized protein LOC110461033 n=1 Tax=Mizuhopecten yessoensis TaxID=6573 RepID=UPI000B45CD11|nr:uncharacterized protein LOC110461033 [Mizuhopecten yessoensis]
MLSAKKEAAVAKRELDAMYDEMDRISRQSVHFSKHEVPEGITQDRVEEQNKQFNNSICAKQLPHTEEHLPLNSSAISVRPDHAKLECPAQGLEIVQPPIEHVWNQGHSNNHHYPFQGFSEFLMRKELLSSRLVKFDDKPESFLSWRATFCSIMDEMKVSAAEEIDLLIKWLGPQSGKHATSIRNASTDNYARGLSLIWKRLDERYGSPKLIEASMKKKLANFTKITEKEKGKLNELADILMEIQSCKANPKYEKLLGHFDTTAGINPVVIKLPKNLQNKWRDRATNFKRNHDVPFPPFDYFVSYINICQK